MILVIMDFFIISIELSFGVSLEDVYSAVSHLKLLAFFCILINVLIGFNTNFYEYGVAVQSRKKIIKNYLVTGFFLDLIVILTLIINYIFPFSHLSIFFVLISKSCMKTIRNFKENYQTGDYFDLLSILFKTIFLAHIIACLWHALAFFSIESSLIDSSWLLLHNYIDLSWQTRYIISLYWTITTMSTAGYGDITPQNPGEMSFCCMVMLIGTFGFGYCINTVGVLIYRMEESSKEFNENMKTVDSYMKRKNISQNLKIKVKKYLEFLWNSQNKNLEKEEEILGKLPLSLRNEILLQSNVKFLKEFQIFTGNFSQETIEFMALNFKPIHFSPADLIYSQESFEDPAIFLILEGEIELSIKNLLEKQVILKKLQKGDFFGERPFFFNTNYQETATSNGFSTILKINRLDFLNFLIFHPKDHERFCEIRDKALFQANNNVDEAFYCYSCIQKGHFFEECPLLRYIPNKSFIIQRLNFTKPQKRGSFLRKNCKKNTLKDIKNNFKNALKLRFSKSVMPHFKLENKLLSSESEISECSNSNEELKHSKSLEISPEKAFDINSKHKKYCSLRESDGGIQNTFCPEKAEIAKMFEFQENILEKGHDQYIYSIKSPQISHKFSYESLPKLCCLKSKKSLELKEMSEMISEKKPTRESFLSINFRTKSKEDEDFISNNDILSPLHKKMNKPKENLVRNKTNSFKLKKNLKNLFKSRDSTTKSPTSRTFKTEKTDVQKKTEKKNALFWEEFEKMKEFKCYFKENNASNVATMVNAMIRMNKGKKTRDNRLMKGSIAFK